MWSFFCGARPTRGYWRLDNESFAWSGDLSPTSSRSLANDTPDLPALEAAKPRRGTKCTRRSGVIFDKELHLFTDIHQTRDIRCEALYKPLRSSLDLELWEEDQSLRKSILCAEGFLSWQSEWEHQIERHSDKGWPVSHPNWYHYTNAAGQTKGKRHDPNVWIAYDLCPELKDGSFCLDPFLPDDVLLAAVATQEPPSWSAMNRRTLEFRWDERIRGNRRETVLTPFERAISRRWKPLYNDVRTQRIVAGDPLLSVLELFCLKMAMGTLHTVQMAEDPREWNPGHSWRRSTVLAERLVSNAQSKPKSVLSEEKLKHNHHQEVTMGERKPWKSSLIDVIRLRSSTDQPGESGTVSDASKDSLVAYDLERPPKDFLDWKQRLDDGKVWKGYKNEYTTTNV